MSLQVFIDNLKANSDWSGTSNLGLFNVESAHAAFRTQWLPRCECNCMDMKAFQYDCAHCGKARSNNLALPAGDGDGLYTVVAFTNNQGQVFATATLFDVQSQLAQKFQEEIDDCNITEFDSIPILFNSDLPGIKIGKLSLDSTSTVFFSDENAGIDSPMPTVWVEDWLDGDITAYAFVEPSTDSPSAKLAMEWGTSPEQYNGGLESSFRPRLVLLISDAYPNMANNLENLELTPNLEATQFEAWSKQVVAAHVNEQNSVAIYWNGRLENNFAVRDSEKGGDYVMDYLFREFSWYLQGATFGNEDCAKAAAEMAEESQGKLEQPEFLIDAYRIRGLFTMAQSAVQETSHDGAKFCSQCGTPVSQGSKFCSQCGASL